jgi:hypothetical protein
VNKSKEVYSRALIGLSFIVLLLPLSILAANVDDIEEDVLKAIYSFKFGKFTEWPKTKLNDRNTTLGFCILGKNPFTQAALETIETAVVKGRKLQVMIYGSGLLSNDALDECHILYVSQSEKTRQLLILSALRNKPILTVSDIEGFSQKGGMITLININQKIQIEINPGAIIRASLEISSKLIELAKVVNGQIPGANH